MQSSINSGRYVLSTRNPHSFWVPEKISGNGKKWALYVAKLFETADAFLSLSSKYTEWKYFEQPNGKKVGIVLDSFYFEGSKTKNTLLKIFKVVTWGFFIRYTKGIPLVVALVMKLAFKGFTRHMNADPLVEFKDIRFSDQQKSDIVKQLRLWIESHFNGVKFDPAFPDEEYSKMSPEEGFNALIQDIITYFSDHDQARKGPRILRVMTLPKDNVPLAIVTQHILIQSWRNVIAIDSVYYAWSNDNVITNDSYNAFSQALSEVNSDLVQNTVAYSNFHNVTVYPKLRLGTSYHGVPFSFSVGAP